MKQTLFIINIFIIFFFSCVTTKSTYKSNLVTKDSNVVDTTNYKCMYQFKYLYDSIKNIYDEELYVIQIGESFTKSYCYQLFYFDSINNIPGRMVDNGMTDYISSNRPADGIITPAFMEGFKKFTNGYFQFYVYKDYTKEKIIITDYISAAAFLYEDELKPQDWIIKEDTTTILGYSCQKAICSFRGRDWEAWFTSEIPISEGPYKFYGLPGLIMKLEDTELHYSFIINSFQKVKEPIHIRIFSKKMDRISFLKLKMNRTGVDIAAMESAKIGIYGSTVIHHDHIERDYK
jgi:Protein of unknown function (Porph_ging).